MEFKNSKMSQLTFKFPFKKKYFEQDFFVSSNNFSAYKLIESWPNWPGKWLNVYGASGSGKTHLSKILEKRIEKILILDENKVNDRVISELNKNSSVDPNILAYVNRLSDFFFVLSRFLKHSDNVSESYW